MEGRPLRLELALEVLELASLILRPETVLSHGLTSLFDRCRRCSEGRKRMSPSA